MDSTEIPVYGEQEHSAYNGHFESVCDHPLLLFNSEGDCLAARLRPDNVHSAEDWEDVLLPEVERQQELGNRAVAPPGKPAMIARQVNRMAENDGEWSSVREIHEKRPRTRGRAQNGAESLRLSATDADQIFQKRSTTGSI